MKLIFHMSLKEDWQRAEADGTYPGSANDIADGFIHFSTAEQVADSAAKHRAEQPGLVLLSINPDSLGPALKWEPARGGQLFPHLYGALSPGHVERVDDLPLDRDRFHVFPDDLGIRPRSQD